MTRVFSDESRLQTRRRRIAGVSSGLFYNALYVGVVRGANVGAAIKHFGTDDIHVAEWKL